APFTLGLSAVALGDLNEDGKLDAVTGGTFGSPTNMFFLRGDGAGGVTLPITTRNFRTPQAAMGMGDVNRDRHADVVGALQNGNPVGVVLGTGDGGIFIVREFATGSAPSGVVIGDLNRDGKPDIATANAFGNTVSVLLGNGDGTFQAKRDFGAGDAPIALAAGDVNADGWLDLAVTNANSNSVSVLLNNGAPPAQSTGVGPRPQGAGGLELLAPRPNPSRGPCELRIALA